VCRRDVFIVALEIGRGYSDGSTIFDDMIDVNIEFKFDGTARTTIVTNALSMRKKGSMTVTTTIK
jgi:hypothetical protein